MIEKNTCKINEALDHSYSSVNVAQAPCDSSIESTEKAKSNNKVPNVAIGLLPKSELFTERPQPDLMAFYNDSNRVPGHETHWNSR
jgi:hypothetical protein